MVYAIPQYASNFLSGPPDRLARLVAASTTFQQVCAVGTADDALAHIHYPLALDRLALSPRPRAIIDPNGTGRSFNDEGLKSLRWMNFMLLMFEFEVLHESNVLSPLYGIPAEDIEYTGYGWFTEKVGNIIREMWELAGCGNTVYDESHLNLRSIDFSEGPESYAYEELEQEPDVYVPYVWWIELTVECN